MAVAPVGWALSVAVGLLIWAGGSNAAAATRGADTVSFNRDVRPILSEHCYACHGPDENKRKAGLRLDQEADARKVLKSGRTAVVAGDPEASALIHRVLETDVDEVMPPPEMKKPLTPAKIAVLRRWIEGGARFEGHWAYSAPTRPEFPEVRDTAWAVNEIDRFVLARLEKEGLKPSPPASREKLLRRATLDLTGLPPTVEEVDAFLADNDSKAYEKVVDRLLASPHYGERMAQMWLDLARYGETQGYHHDRHRDLWHWRDWVIRAFNENKPYDQFTTEQLAGDLLPKPTQDQLVATGFHRNEMTTSEGGALPEEYSVKYVVGRVDTTARVWMGSSMACAECHDHKYDPISQKDFYRFFGFFNQVPENGLDAEELNPVPRMSLETESDRAKLAQYDLEVRALETSLGLMLESPRNEWDRAQEAWERSHRENHVGGWTAARLISAETVGTGRWGQAADEFIGMEAGSARRAYELALEAGSGELTGIRLETAEAPKASGKDGPGGGFAVSKLTVVARAKRPDEARKAAGAVGFGDWHLAGPFVAASGREAVDKAFGPETAVGVDGVYLDGKVRWTARADWKGEGTYRVAESVTGNSAHYLYRRLTVPKSQVRTLTLSAEAGAQVWLNGKRVHARNATSDKNLRAETVGLWLRSGENHLVLKLAGSEGAGRFSSVMSGDPLLEVSVALAAAAADTNHEGRPLAGLLDEDPATGWRVGDSKSHVAWVAFQERVGFEGGTELRVRLDSGASGQADLPERVRISTTRADELPKFLGLPDPVRNGLARKAEELGDGERVTLRKHYRQSFVSEVQEAAKLHSAKRTERDSFRNGWPSTMVMRDAEKPKDSFVLIRGQYNQRGEKVAPGVPEALFRWKPEWPANRLGLTQWLLDPGHPLTARVAVNQYWQRYFGTGIVKTAEEFGSQGEWPSHPDLLDWLASEFVRSGWNVKALQRTIVLSATYRQDSAVSKEALEKDPENRLFTRGPRFRVEAEGIRDIAMATSGLLNPKIGGPSVYPYQPPGLWGQVSFEGTRDYVQSEGPENYRRGLYTYWRRSIPYASFTVFDAPTRETCTVRRPRTNTPLQALNLLNDPVYVEAARALGQRVLNRGGRTTDERLEYLFKVCLGRRPSDREREILKGALEREIRNFAENREAANKLIHVGASRAPVDVDIVELAAWTVLGNTLLNLDETVTKG